MEPLWYIDGAFVKQSEAQIPADDAGLIRGCGLFEYARVYQGVPVLLDKHIDRLFASAKTLDIPLTKSREEITSLVHELIAKNDLPEAGVKMVVTGGRALDLLPTAESALYILFYPFEHFPERHYSEGLRLRTTTHTRPFPTCKTTFYLPGILARKEAIRAGGDEGVFTSSSGHLLECPTSNLFFYDGEMWHTPKKDVLLGVTREVLLSFAEVIERDIHISELPHFTEVCTTSTNREVMPICEIDDHRYPVGPATKALMHQYALFVQRAVSLALASP